MTESPENKRIQKVLSEAGVTSRRGVEEMIVEGRITVNGRLVTKLPCFVDPERDEIRLDGQPVRSRRARYVYFLLNKPRGSVCAQSDPQGRPRAIDMVPSFGGRVYCVGGLDDQSTGLVIITNDGQLTRALTDPRGPMEMTYMLEVDGRPAERALHDLKRGPFVEGRRMPGAKVTVIQGHPTGSILEIRTTQGRNRVLRMVFHQLGHKIRRLKRTAIGPINDRGLKIGHYRVLTPPEVNRLVHAVERGRARKRESRK